MIGPSPTALLTSRIRQALAALPIAGLHEPDTVVPSPPGAPETGRPSGRYRAEVLRDVISGRVWAPELLAIAVGAACDILSHGASPADRFEQRIHAALAGFWPELQAMADRGDLDSSDPELGRLRTVIDGGTVSGEDLSAVVRAAFRLHWTGSNAPRMRLYEADRRTPYTVPVSAPTIFLALLREAPEDEGAAPAARVDAAGAMESGAWEYDLATASPTLAILRDRVARIYRDPDDFVTFGFAEVRLAPAAGTPETFRQTDVCDVAVRATGGVESYDLHSLACSPHGPSETIEEYAIVPHPAGEVVGAATVQLVMLRAIGLDVDA